MVERNWRWHDGMEKETVLRMMSDLQISLIICTYNRAHYLKDTLTSLLKNDAEAGHYEILIIDNNSSDETPEIVSDFQRSYEQVRYVKETQQGLSFARNRGVEDANFPILLFLDDDIAVGKDFISNWLNFFNHYPDVKTAGGKIHVQFDDPRPGWMSHFLLPLLGHHDFGNSIKEYGKKSYPFGGNMAFKKEIFDKYGTFHTDLGRKGNQLKASEEKEFFQRIKQDDIQIFYVPKAMLYHRVNEKRLTKDYIKKQAIGLGQSIALQFKNESRIQKLEQGFQQLLKSVVTLGLFLPYTFTFQLSKAVMLVKFRKWIIEGYFSVKNES